MAPAADGIGARRRLARLRSMAAEVIRRRVIIRGRVQGVFFRDSIRERAEAGGVAGSVRNRPDGTVEGVFEGPSARVDALVRFCHTGPPHARVEAVEVFDEAVSGEAGSSGLLSGVRLASQAPGYTTPAARAGLAAPGPGRARRRRASSGARCSEDRPRAECGPRAVAEPAAEQALGQREPCRRRRQEADLRYVEVDDDPSKEGLCRRASSSHSVARTPGSGPGRRARGGPQRQRQHRIPASSSGAPSLPSSFSSSGSRPRAATTASGSESANTARRSLDEVAVDGVVAVLRPRPSGAREHAAVHPQNSPRGESSNASSASKSPSAARSTTGARPRSAHRLGPMGTDLATMIAPGLSSPTGWRTISRRTRPVPSGTVLQAGRRRPTRSATRAAPNGRGARPRTHWRGARCVAAASRRRRAGNPRGTKARRRGGLRRPTRQVRAPRSRRHGTLRSGQDTSRDPHPRSPGRAPARCPRARRRVAASLCRSRARRPRTRLRSRVECSRRYRPSLRRQLAAAADGQPQASSDSSAGSSLPARRSRPRWTAAMNLRD